MKGKKVLKHVIKLAMILLAFATVNTAFGQAKQSKNTGKTKDWSKHYQRLQHSVVLIDVENGSRKGTGIVIAIGKNETAYILTAYHVIKGFDEVAIHYNNPSTITDIGKVHPDYYSIENDLSIIEVIKPTYKLKPLDFYSKEPKKGSMVGVVGHPMNSNFSWTNGNIQDVEPKKILHDATLLEGNSGGPLVNRKGLMVGLNLQKSPKQYISLRADAIDPLLRNWIKEDDDTIKDRWKMRGYYSYWRSPGFYVPVAVAIVGSTVSYMLMPGNPGAATFGGPPMPPDY